MIWYDYGRTIVAGCYARGARKVFLTSRAAARWALLHLRSCPKVESPEAAA